jgi:chloramphenicol-sensitive protein RarD
MVRSFLSEHVYIRLGGYSLFYKEGKVMSTENKEWFHGIGSVFLSLFLWGILPLYWKQLDRIPSDQILANRIICRLFLFYPPYFQGRIRELFRQLRKRQNIVLYISGIIISLNWFTYIYAVNSNQIVEASLGYLY